MTGSRSVCGDSIHPRMFAFRTRRHHRHRLRHRGTRSLVLVQGCWRSRLRRYDGLTPVGMVRNASGRRAPVYPPADANANEQDQQTKSTLSEHGSAEQGLPLQNAWRITFIERQRPYPPGFKNLPGFRNVRRRQRSFSPNALRILVNIPKRSHVIYSTMLRVPCGSGFIGVGCLGTGK